MRWVVEQTDVVPRSRRKRAQQEGLFGNTLVMVYIIGEIEHRGEVKETSYVNAYALCEYDAKKECIAFVREHYANIEELILWCDEQEKQLKQGDKR